MYRLLLALVILVNGIECLSCADYRSFHSTSKISIQDLKSMPQEDVVTCMPIFGENPLGEEESSFIWNALVKMRGGAWEVTDTDLRRIGWILQAVPEDNIANFTLNEPDTIAALGRYRNLSETQLQALAERVLEDWANKDASKYTNYDLSAMQHILCGFNRSFIEAIHADSYKDAAASLSQIRGCPAESLEALAGLAQSSDGFGPLSDWTGSQLKYVGCVINGLSKEQILLIPPTAFESLTPDDVPCLQPETIESLSRVQLSQLTPSAIAALSPQQRAKLTKEQSQTLQEAFNPVTVKAAAITNKSTCFSIALTLLTLRYNKQ